MPLITEPWMPVGGIFLAACQVPAGIEGRRVRTRGSNRAGRIGWSAAARALVVAGLALSGRSGMAAPAVLDDTLAQRLAACTVCHGKEGRAAADGYFPRIAGKPAGYLYNQLVNFREGRRVYGPLVALVDPLSDAYLRDIADHFAALRLPYPSPAAGFAPSTLLDRGRQLAEKGDAARGLPACSRCHGAALTGALPATPGLVGLPRDYLISQLGAWVAGQRRARAPDCMADIARRLVGSDIAAVSAWLARQPVPAVSSPVAAVAAPLPMPCGSAPVAAR